MKIILTLLLAMIGFLLYKIYSLTKEKIVKEIDKSCIRLEIPKEIPNFEDHDKDDVLLKDVIESVKLEEWQVEIEEDRGMLHSNSYKITLNNPQKTLRISSRIRYDYRSQLTYVSSFMILKTIPGSVLHNGSVSYDLKKETTKFLVTNFLWSYVLNYKQSLVDKRISYYDDIKKSIESELITLKRDKSINKLLT